MYLKKIKSNKKLEELNQLMPFSFGTWYRKMNDNGIQAQNLKGLNLYTCMSDTEVKLALHNKEFNKVEE